MKFENHDSVYKNNIMLCVCAIHTGLYWPYKLGQLLKHISLFAIKGNKPYQLYNASDIYTYIRVEFHNGFVSVIMCNVECGLDRFLCRETRIRDIFPHIEKLRDINRKIMEYQAEHSSLSRRIREMFHAADI